MLELDCCLPVGAAEWYAANSNDWLAPWTPDIEHYLLTRTHLSYQVVPHATKITSAPVTKFDRHHKILKRSLQN